MKLHELQPAALRKVRNRVNGTSSGNGKTAGRGSKRSKLVAVAVFSSYCGQTPLFRRLPKTWFLERKPQEALSLTLIS